MNTDKEHANNNHIINGITKCKQQTDLHVLQINHLLSNSYQEDYNHETNHETKKSVENKTKRSSEVFLVKIKKF